MIILIIGSDSFIANQFIKTNSDHFNIKTISRIKSEFKNDYIFENLSNIPPSIFEGIEVVLNFIAIVHRPDIKEENLYDEINHKLTILNAQKAKQAGVRLFIQMSSIAVYGLSSKISEATPYGPQTPYGKSKLKADEDLLKLQDDSFKVAIVRPPMVYGGGKAPGNMMRLILLVDKGIPLPFKGINNSRHFINIHNLVQYLTIITEKELNGVFIVSDKEPVSTEYIIKTISKYLGKNVHLLKLPRFAIYILKAISPNEYEKLYGTLEITPNFFYEKLIKNNTVDDGIREMVEWYKNRKKN